MGLHWAHRRMTVATYASLGRTPQRWEPPLTARVSTAWLAPTRLPWVPHPMARVNYASRGPTCRRRGGTLRWRVIVARLGHTLLHWDHRPILAVIHATPGPTPMCWGQCHLSPAKTVWGGLILLGQGGTLFLFASSATLESSLHLQERYPPSLVRTVQLGPILLDQGLSPSQCVFPVIQAFSPLQLGQHLVPPAKPAPLVLILQGPGCRGVQTVIDVPLGCTRQHWGPSPLLPANNAPQGPIPLELGCRRVLAVSDASLASTLQL